MVLERRINFQILGVKGLITPSLEQGVYSSKQHYKMKCLINPGKKMET